MVFYLTFLLPLIKITVLIIPIGIISYSEKNK